ncbi:hypothetical protein LMH87_011914 [Akanthomyces muscarius]|uniref:Uncharacterized protein n=1 Tax=Akanthomyces muscarius TaxID=2231603 RepID=A0A9W8QCJ8_AKAMU|nr:hypothetical protein LMH87_011914 [Akanthomyces muscarius]KAJ4151200.1 hypothetical protein LMH87_011914 [Akanthomyces muscarius]
MSFLFQPPVFAAQPAAGAFFVPQQQPPQQQRVIYTAAPATLFRPATFVGGGMPLVMPLVMPPPATTFINLQRPPLVLSAPMYAVFSPPLPPPWWFP